ncbi:MAG TPA: MFS transporter, partial [Candidatus Deferrimicrobium sp.]|nr:MFS transporter [Candidatus Deferrimicrobium sp.]
MSSIFTKKQKQSITAMALALGLRVFGVSLFLPVFTLFGNELTHNGMLIGLALGVYGLVQAVLQVPFGALSDRFGRKRIILFGLFLYALGSIMAAESSDIYFLIFARVLQGAGAISGAVYAY